ncbi:MAG: GNAT family N-acetyltransferase [Alphaproteobacteria bacterium]|nr:GNAT family N-acetyltransferase [Alphaproteobacteria bacterium]
MTIVRHVEKSDQPGWERLYRGYANFYRVDTDDTKLQTLFGWLLDPGHVCEGLVAESDAGDLVGLAHFRAMPSPLRGAEVGFLDDLFVDPGLRGGGAGELLLREIDEIAAGRGWAVVRWITRDNNYRARGLYDRLSVRSDWITYEMTAVSTGRDAG